MGHAATEGCPGECARGSWIPGLELNQQGRWQWGWRRTAQVRLLLPKDPDAGCVGRCGEGWGQGAQAGSRDTEGTVWGFSVGRWPGPWRKKGNSAALCPCSCLDPCPGPQSAGSGRCHLSPQEGPGLEGCPVPSGDTGPRGQRSHLKYGPWKPRGARSVGYAADFRDVKREKQIKCLFHDLYIKMFKW